MTPPRVKLRIFLALALLTAAFAGTGCERIRDTFSDNGETAAPQPTPPAQPVQSIHLPFGNPSNANEQDRNNYLIVGRGSVISYNESRGTANWVAWRTVKSDLAASIPRPDFRPDPRLPDGFRRIVHSDYSGSGYDRGHLVPSADRFADRDLNEETFMMTNIVPQEGALNQYPWEKLESYARGQARRGNDVYQIAGGYGDKGTIKGRVVIPTNCWKVIVILPRGITPERVDARVRVIAVDMPNIEGIEKTPWERYKTTVRDLEIKTGLNIFSALPAELQETIENRIETANVKR